MWRKSRSNQERNKSFSTRETFSVFVTNYPQNTPLDLLLEWLNSLVEEKFGFSLEIGQKTLLNDGITFTVGDMKQFDGILMLNGVKILNQNLWIVSLPGPLTFLAETISHIYNNNRKEEDDHVSLDLSFLPTKFLSVNANPENVDFNSRWFIEFLFFRIGYEDKDKHNHITHLNLMGNQISSIKRWDKFWIFLPQLEEVNLQGNCLTEIPDQPSSDINFVVNPSTQAETVPWSVTPAPSSNVFQPKWRRNQNKKQEKDSETIKKWAKRAKQTTKEVSFGGWEDDNDDDELQNDENMIHGSWGTPVNNLVNNEENDEENEEELDGW